MITRCPNCGAVASLDSLLAGEDAADLLVMVAALDAGVGKAALRYLGLFRPGKGRLTFGRSAKLLGELMPDMQRQAVSRGGVDYPAPPAAWLYGFQTALDARDTSRLKLPLKSHGWLYEVMAAWDGGGVLPQGQVVAATAPAPKRGQAASKTLAAAAALEGLRRG